MSGKINADVKKRYAKDSAKYRPKTPYLKNFLIAFGVGGLISAAGQAVHEMFVHRGFDDVEAGARMAVLLVIVGGVLTGIGIYDRLGKVAGAGSAVPISGFSNSMVSSAMENTSDGYVLGMGSQMFTISGPVLVTGVGTAVIFTVIRFLIMQSGGL